MARPLEILGRARRLLGLRAYRRLTLARRPLGVVLHLSRRPSLSLSAWRCTLHLGTRGATLSLPLGGGLGFRRRILAWPWRRRRRWSRP